MQCALGFWTKSVPYPAMNPSEPRSLCTPEFKAQAVELLAIGRPVVETRLRILRQRPPPPLVEINLQALQVGSVGENAAAQDLRSRVCPILIGIYRSLFQELVSDQGGLPALKRKFQESECLPSGVRLF